MQSNHSDRRRFLKQTAALAGVAAGAGLAVRGESAQAQKGEAAEGQHVHREPPRRGARYSIDHLTHYTPLQDYAGIITPAPVHFVQQHSMEFPQIDAAEHRLTIHGLVDRPLTFTMDDLKRLPSVSRIHFVECHGNSSPATMRWVTPSIARIKSVPSGLPPRTVPVSVVSASWTRTS